MRESLENTSPSEGQWVSALGFIIAFVGIFLQFTSSWGASAHIFGAFLSILGLVLSANKKYPNLTTAIQLSLLLLMMTIFGWKLWSYLS